MLSCGNVAIMLNEYMLIALREAEAAAESGDVPVGAVIVKDGQVIAAAHNTREKDGNAVRHAEITAIERACAALGDWRLDGCDMYVTLEPCMMCAGAVSQARLRRLYFGAYDRERGYVASNPIDGFDVEYYCGIMEKECAAALDEFFEKVRQRRD